MKQKLYSEFVETVTSTRLCAGDSCWKATWNRFHSVDLLFKGKLPLWSPYIVNLLHQIHLLSAFSEVSAPLSTPPKTSFLKHECIVVNMRPVSLQLYTTCPKKVAKWKEFISWIDLVRWLPLLRFGGNTWLNKISDCLIKSQQACCT